MRISKKADVQNTVFFYSDSLIFTNFHTVKQIKKFFGNVKKQECPLYKDKMKMKRYSNSQKVLINIYRSIGNPLATFNTEQIY